MFNFPTSGQRKNKKSLGPNGGSQLAAGGEIYQIAGKEHPALTTNQGVAISDNQN
jgi:catalase